jgi:hypothetical protein
MSEYAQPFPGWIQSLVEMEPEEERKVDALPVIIITGAPGSGKTLLLNRLLASLDAIAPGAVPAVITHRLAREFGLDLHPVAAGAEAAGAMLRGEMFDFGSGCVCCSPSGDLLQHLLAVKRVLARSEHSALHDAQPASPAAQRADSTPAATLEPSSPPPTHVLIETTGLADPSAFVQLINSHPQLSAFRLAALVTLVDAAAALPLLADGSAVGNRRFREQLHAADVIALAHTTRSAVLPGVGAREPHDATLPMNEATLPSTEAILLIKEVLAEGQPADGSSAPIVGAHELDWARLMAVGSERSALLRGEGSAAACSLPAAGPIRLETQIGGPGGGPGGGGHDGAFDTVCLVEEGAVFPPTLRQWLTDIRLIANRDPSRLLRIKGVLTVLRDRPTLSASSAALDTDERIGEESERRCIEWSVGMGEAVQEHTLDPTLPAQTAVPRRALAHTLVAGLDAPVGVCKVLFVGTRLPVNALRQSLWQAMVPPGFALAAEIELDFPLAHRFAHGEAASGVTRSEGAGAAESQVQWSALRLGGWLDARDVLLFWVDGSFCALADFEAGDARSWQMEQSRFSRAREGSGCSYLLSAPQGESSNADLAIDLSTGRRVLSHTVTLTPSDSILQRLELRIIGGSVYVSHKLRASSGQSLPAT